MRKIIALFLSLFPILSFSQGKLTYDDSIIRKQIVEIVKLSISEQTHNKIISKQDSMIGNSIYLILYQDSTGQFSKIDVRDRTNSLTRKEKRLIKRKIKNLGAMDILVSPDELHYLKTKERLFFDIKYREYYCGIKLDK